MILDSDHMRLVWFLLSKLLKSWFIYWNCFLKLYRVKLHTFVWRRIMVVTVVGLVAAAILQLGAGVLPHTLRIIGVLQGADHDLDLAPMTAVRSRGHKFYDKLSLELMKDQVYTKFTVIILHTYYLLLHVSFFHISYWLLTIINF